VEERFGRVQKLWDELVSEVVRAQDESDEEDETMIDRKGPCVGINVLVQSGCIEQEGH
jgi:hypothetical protein